MFNTQRRLFSPKLLSSRGMSPLTRAKNNETISITDTLREKDD